MFLMRLRNTIIGISITFAALALASYLVSILFVLSQFSGNARFPADCGVVFGSAVQERRGVSPGELRTETAVRLLKEEKITRLIFTGGAGERSNGLSEARLMRNTALRLGVSPEVIVMEEGAQSTWQNIKFIQPFIRNCASVVAISDRYHLARIRFAAWRQGLDMMVHPADRVANPVFEIRSILREAVGVLVYMVMMG